MSPFLPALPAEPTLKGTCLVREFFSFGFASLPKRSFQLEFFFFKTTGNPPSDIGRFLSDSQSRGDRPTCHSFRPLETCSPGTSSRFGHHPSVQYQEQLLAAEADKLQDLDLPGSSSEDELPESSENSPPHQGKPPSPTSLGGPRVFASRPTYSIDSAGNARYIEPKPIVQESFSPPPWEYLGRKAEDGRLVCKNWFQTKVCLFGSACKFAHSDPVQ